MIYIENLSKSYNKKCVLKNLSLDIYDGEITILIGKNGSGKTTLMKLISGLIKPDCGSIRYDDESIGIMLGGDTNLYDKLTGYENIEFFAHLHDMSKNMFDKRYDELSQILKFKDFADEKVSTYSRGMRQKIAFAISIIHNPSTILLDEPSTGLDLTTVFDVINFLKYCKNENKTVFISTHNLFEITRLGDRMAVLKNGKIISCDYNKDVFSQKNEDEVIDMLQNVLESDYE